MFELWTLRQGKHHLDQQRIRWTFPEVKQIWLFDVGGRFSALLEAEPGRRAVFSMKADSLEAKVLGLATGEHIALRPLRDTGDYRWSTIVTIPLPGGDLRGLAWSPRWGDSR